MILDFKVDGTITLITPENIYKGSVGVHKLEITGEFPATSTISVNYELPSKKEVAGGIATIKGSLNAGSNVWIVDMVSSAYSEQGQVKLSLKVLDNELNTLQTGEVYIEILPSIAQELPLTPSDDAWDLLATNITQLQNNKHNYIDINNIPDYIDYAVDGLKTDGFYYNFSKEQGGETLEGTLLSMQRLDGDDIYQTEVIYNGADRYSRVVTYIDGVLTAPDFGGVEVDYYGATTDTLNLDVDNGTRTISGDVLDSPKLGGELPEYYATESDLTDLEDRVTDNEGAIALNTAHREGDGSDHAFIDQDVTQTAKPTFSGIKLTPSLDPAYEEGSLYYDDKKKQPTFMLPEQDVRLNLGFELMGEVYWNGAGTLLNGTVVTQTGETMIVGDKELPVVSKADCNFREKTFPLAMVTHDIESGTIGYVTKAGNVADVDTTAWAGLDTSIVYLGEDGGITPIRPVDGCFPVIVGSVIKVATDGNIVVSVSASELTVDVTNQNGFPRDERFKTSLTVDNSTRTFNVTKLNDYHFYQNGEKFEITDDRNITFNDVEGTHLIVFDEGVLSVIENVTSAQFQDAVLYKTLVSVFYWNTTDQRTEFILDERHGLMNPETHLWAHLAIGSIYVSGMIINISDIDDVTPNTNLAVEYGITSGVNKDEDIEHNVIEKTTTDNIREYAFVGTGTPNYTRVSETPYGISVGVNGRPVYNELVGTTYQLSEVPSNSYTWRHIYATTETDKTRTNYISMVSFGNYGSKSDAEGGRGDEVVTINSFIPEPEYTYVGSILYQCRDTYSNDYKARIVSLDDGADYFDGRETKASGSGSITSNDHSTLSGRSLADQHPASSITYTNTTSGLTAIETQSAIDELASEKLDTADAVGQKSTGTGAEIFNDYTNNTASGDYSKASGELATASGRSATVLGGEGNIASGRSATVGGAFSQANGDYSNAFGNNVIANPNTSTIIGRFGDVPVGYNNAFCIADGTASYLKSLATTFYAGTLKTKGKVYTEAEYSETTGELENGKELATVESVPTNTSDLINDSGFIDNTVSDLVNYTTTTDLNNALNLKANSADVYLKTETYSQTETDNLLAGKLDSVVAGTNITVDNTDPNNPIINSTASSPVTSVNGEIGDVVLTTNDLTNDSGYITNTVSDLVNYYTTTQTDNLLDDKADQVDLDSTNADITEIKENLTVGTYPILKNKDILTPNQLRVSNNTLLASAGRTVYASSSSATDNKVSRVADGTADNDAVNYGQVKNKLDSVVGGTNITIDNTDPNNPIINGATISGGLPTGGTAGQILAKIDGTDYNTQWQDERFTTTLESKLNGIEAGAEVNNISDADATNLTDGGNTSLHRHNFISSSTTLANNISFTSSNTVETTGITSFNFNNETKLSGILSGTASTDAVNKGQLDLKENSANKSTSTSLGTSNTLFPTQNAVKTYVDASLLKAENGYKTLNDGFLICWGFTSVPANSTKVVTFTKSFLATPRAVASAYDSDIGDRDNMGTANVSATNITLVNGHSAARYIHFIAIGWWK